MDIYESRTFARVIAELDLEILRLTKLLVYTEASDYSVYRAKVGYIKGLQNAIGMIKQVEQEFRREEAGVEPLPAPMDRYED